MTSDLLSVNFSKCHCKCFQLQISFHSRHKSPLSTARSPLHRLFAQMFYDRPQPSPLQHFHLGRPPPSAQRVKVSDCNKKSLSDSHDGPGSTSYLNGETSPLTYTPSRSAGETYTSSRGSHCVFTCGDHDQRNGPTFFHY